MKHLVVCTDGTWNRSEMEVEGKRGVLTSTNVSKIASIVSPEGPGGVPQLVFYLEGVGSRREEAISGGAFGWGLSRNVLQAYDFLCRNFEPGDRIFLFGFSRGAFTARSIVGLVHNSGVVRNAEDIPAAFALYRDKSDSTKPDSIKSRVFRAQHSYEPEVEFLGIWDTVGTIGIPGLRGAFAKLLGWDWKFHDVTARAVRRISHALAIHERRCQFLPTPVQVGSSNPCVVTEQWFAGVHSDVGGGYLENGLSNITLDWMVGQAEDAGLAFDAGWRDSLPIAGDADPRKLPEANSAALDSLCTNAFRRHESWAGFYRLYDFFARPLPDGVRDAGVLHPSVERIAMIFPRMSVEANQPWTRWDGTIVKGRTYKLEIKVKQELKDASIPVGDPTAGIPEDQTVFLQRILRRFRRVKDRNYMQLIASINRRRDLTYCVDSNPFSLTADATGTLEFFFNDVWGFYSNNSGQIEIAITPV